MVTPDPPAPPMGEVLRRFDVAGVPERWSRAAQGSNGRVWRLDVAAPRRVLAVKELFLEPAPERITAEIGLRDAAAAAGVGAPAALRSIDGAYVEWFDTTPIRVSTWASGRPARPDDAGCAEWLGQTLGVLHSMAYPSDGFPPARSTTPPELGTWRELSERARSAAMPWASALAAAVPLLERLTTGWSDDRGVGHVVSHRDVQPDNVVHTATSEGSGGSVGPTYTLLDWDGAGPTNPARELVSRLVTWHGSDGRIDEDGIRRTTRAYLAAGGTARPVEADAFGGVPDGLHHLARQIRRSIDPTTEPAMRVHAAREVGEEISELPAEERLLRVVKLCRDTRATS